MEVGYYAINSLKMNFWIALVFSMIVCDILGVVIEFLAYRPLRNSTRISALITAIGVSFFLEYIMVYFVGADTRSFPQSIKVHTYHLGSISVNRIVTNEGTYHVDVSMGKVNQFDNPINHSITKGK